MDILSFGPSDGLETGTVPIAAELKQLLGLHHVLQFVETVSEFLSTMAVLIVTNIEQFLAFVDLGPHQPVLGQLGH